MWIEQKDFIVGESPALRPHQHRVLRAVMGQCTGEQYTVNHQCPAPHAHRPRSECGKTLQERLASGQMPSFAGEGGGSGQPLDQHMIAHLDNRRSADQPPAHRHAGARIEHQPQRTLVPPR